MQLLDFIGGLVRTDEEADTINRLFKSKHLKDLRLIVNVTLWTSLLMLPIGLLVSFEYQRVNHWDLVKTEPVPVWVYIHLLFAAGASLLAWLAPGVAVVGAVLAWAYQAGSARLGVVDLFACEVSTLCRIVTVLDSVRRLTGSFNIGPGALSGAACDVASGTRFTSQEEYFPVFENNTSALEALEARVVVNITAFYTYMKAVRDSMRSLAEMAAQPPPAAAWHDGARNVIYVMYLGLESARKAVDDLVEFDPEKAERTIVILISELEAYRFLRQQFTDPTDIRYQRITLRLADYERLVPQVRATVVQGNAEEESAEANRDPQQPALIEQWKPAWLLLDELNTRFAAAVSPTP
jgi:hypothetical protein